MPIYPLACPRCKGRVNLEVGIKIPEQEPLYPENSPMEKLSKIFMAAEERLKANEFREMSGNAWKESNPLQITALIGKNFGDLCRGVSLQQNIDKHAGDIVVLLQNLLDVFKTKHGEY